ncbi:MAG: hypothetical protein CSA62_14455 [Planctomycetota bacterium]|nr:MAG: hypothetical protein CSA62_14455 [Planctomycetota bacterium]
MVLARKALSFAKTAALGEPLIRAWTMNDKAELHFCDLCGFSVPDRDLEEGLARKLGDKTVGVCCLAKLTKGDAESPAPAPARVLGGGVSGSQLLVIAGILLLAILATAGLSDWRTEARHLETQEQQKQQLEAKVEFLRLRIEELREDQAAVVRQALAGQEGRIQARFEAMDAQLAKLLPKQDGGLVLAKLGGGLRQLLANLDELKARSDKLEKTVAGMRESFERERLELRQSLQDLQRKAAAGAYAGQAAGGSSKGLQTLPQQLGRSVDKLASSDPGRRWEAVDELVRSGDKRVLPYLVPVLKDMDPYVRKICAEGIGKIGDPSYGMELVGALEDEAAIVRKMAYRSLVKLSGKNFPFDPEASESQRKKAIVKWRQWAKSVQD